MPEQYRGDRHRAHALPASDGKTGEGGEERGNPVVSIEPAKFAETNEIRNQPKVGVSVFRIPQPTDMGVPPATLSR